MQVKRFSDAKPYEAPNHRAYSSLRLFGAEAGGTQTLIVGISHFLPGGGAGPDACRGGLLGLSCRSLDVASVARVSFG